MKNHTFKYKRFALVLATVLVAGILLTIWASRVRIDRYGADATVAFDTEMVFYCELADTDAKRAMGLMHRERLDPDRGMLFVFEAPTNVSFWMKNTHIPLDIIFMDEDGVVLNIAEADPEPGIDYGNLTRYESAGPVKWVLEINQGLSEKHGISPGAEATITITGKIQVLERAGIGSSDLSLRFRRNSDLFN